MVEADGTKRTKRCGECGTSNIRATPVSAGGGYAPDLLPGAIRGGNARAVLEVYVLPRGHFQYFVPATGLEGVPESKKFWR